ncbi:hypothetical protein V5799_024525 [Amblyomma americanum]|uniref:Uncharacterized protein n=1 Tax=Amblyomma americanum TaxID=6943 RepID=A0AAQ4EBT4_AMBAM
MQQRRHVQHKQKKADVPEKNTQKRGQNEEKVLEKIRLARNTITNAELLFAKSVKSKILQMLQAVLKNGQERLAAALSELESQGKKRNSTLNLQF